MFMFMSRGFFRYVFMPEILSRARILFLSGFANIPYLLALVYQLVGLLPRYHPYLNSRNIGRYGIRHVIGEAGRNVKYTFKNIDQILLFYLVLFGIVVFCLQFFSVLAFGFFQSAMAAVPSSWSDFFEVNPPAAREQDIAYIFLDMVFGVPHPSIDGAGFFESCVASSVNCTDTLGQNLQDLNGSQLGLSTTETALTDMYASGAHTIFPFPLHKGLHTLFGIYNTGLLMVAVIITTYFIVTILAETAQTGTAFGRRFNKVWAPIRLVVAFGLLMPLSIGLNSSQYIVLYAAKYGSAFATNGWQRFNDALTTSYLGDAESLIVRPTLPDVAGFTQYMFVAKVCEYIYDREAGSDIIRPYVLLEQSNVAGGSQEGSIELTSALFPVDNILNKFEKTADGVGPGSIRVILGEYNKEKYPKQPGYIFPTCGQIDMTFADPRVPQFGGTYPNGAQAGIAQLQYYYWGWFLGQTILDMPVSVFYSSCDGGCGTPPATVSANRRHVEFANSHNNYPKESSDSVPLDQAYKSDVMAGIYSWLNTFVDSSVATQRTYAASIMSATNSPWMSNSAPLYSKGWAAAGIWYNSVSELNGSFTEAVANFPVVASYPAIMELVASKKAEFDEDVSPLERFRPDIKGVDDPSKYLSSAKDQQIATTLYAAFRDWGSEDGISSQAKPTGNPISDTITLLMGTNGLYDMRRNMDVHPLAQITGIGRALVEAAIRNLGYAGIAGVGGILVGDIFGPFVGKIGGTIASLMISVATMQISIGFVLCYIIPFLPFLYFFFAVGGWVKGIFEAMVGAPLWALAHIRIDGEGLPGRVALGGYFLIFEIFLRPILIIFGLLASVATYSALVSVLNSVFDLVTQNVGGFDYMAEFEGVQLEGTTQNFSMLDQARGKVDQFFFTIIYAVVVYMMGMSSFKLIDTIPNEILRWMGQSISTFNDSREDPAQGLISRSSGASQQIAGKLGGSLGSVAKLANGA